jgi:hypothetical protein
MYESKRKSFSFDLLIPEQFTLKAHPALFEKEGRGKKIEEHFPEASA